MKEWYLQRRSNGQYFWDDMIHNDCTVALTERFASGYTPFNPELGERNGCS